MVKSISNHYSLSTDDIQILSSPEIIGNKKAMKKTGMVNILGNWNDHYRSWTRI